MDIRKMKAAVIDALEEIKAKNIVMLNVSKLTSLFDYLVVASGDSNRQTRALADNVKERLKAAGATIYGTEGEESGEWVLVDLGDIVVHAMVPATRDYYRLEDLWREGKLEIPKPKSEARKPASGKAAPAKAKKGKVAGAKPKTGSKAKGGTKFKIGSTGKVATKAKSGSRVKTAARTKAGATVKAGTKVKTAVKTVSRTRTGTRVKAGSGTTTTARNKTTTATSRRKKAV